MFVLPLFARDLATASAMCTGVWFEDKFFILFFSCSVGVSGHTSPTSVEEGCYFGVGCGCDPPLVLFSFSDISLARPPLLTCVKDEKKSRLVVICTKLRARWVSWVRGA